MQVHPSKAVIVDLRHGTACDSEGQLCPEVLLEAIDRHAILFHRVPISDGYGRVLERVEVAPRREGGALSGDHEGPRPCVGAASW